jgi:RNA polymerase sigma-70 factor, ECF subfamily
VARLGPGGRDASSDLIPTVNSDNDLDERLAQLLRRCASADGLALQRLYELASPLLFALLIRMLRRRAVAEEALQDVFVTVWERAGQFRPERGRATTWLMSIARYRAIDLLRREHLAPVLALDFPEHAVEAEAAEEPGADPFPRAALLERCLGLLSAEQRRCLELAFVGGNSHMDIARLVGSPMGTVKSWIRRGLQSLKACLES